MQRLVSSYNPLFFVLLVLLAVGLRWPQFTTGHLTNEEALLLTAGQRIAGGAALYSETWVDLPPALPYVYAAAVALAGDHALLALRIVALVSVLLGALLMLVLYQQYRLAQHGSGWIALVYVVALSVPWYGLGLTRESLLVLLQVWLVYHLVRMNEGAPRWGSLALVGLLCGLCVLVDYRAILVLPAAVVMQFVLRPLRADELMTILLATLTTLALVLLILLLQGALTDATEVSFWGSWQRMWSTTPTAPQAHPVQGLVEAFLTWGGLLVLALLGMGQLRARFFSVPIRVRKANTLMLIWLGLGLLLLFMTVGSLQVTHVVLVLPPLVFFAAYVLDHRPNVRWHLAGLVLLVLPMAYGLLLLHWVEHPPQGVWARFDPGRRLPQLRRELDGPPELAALQARTAQLGPEATFWTSRPVYDLYLRLDRPCGLKYLDQAPTRRLVRIDPRSAGGWAFGQETLPEVYMALQREQPTYVYDPDSLFARIRQRIPWLQQTYQPDPCPEGPCFRWVAVEPLAVQ